MLMEMAPAKVDLEDIRRQLNVQLRTSLQYSGDIFRKDVNKPSTLESKSGLEAVQRRFKNR